MSDQLPPQRRYAALHANDEQHPAPTASPSPAFDLDSELTKLMALNEQGILNDEKFREAKRRLLGFW